MEPHLSDILCNLSKASNRKGKRDSDRLAYSDYKLPPNPLDFGIGINNSQDPHIVLLENIAADQIEVPDYVNDEAEGSSPAALVNSVIFPQ